ncbi:hypothetical protein [Enterococcus casseliflavus]|uniref:hypothetical protein n=1 Tax=Enterococcus casseliflavus TaxID=37734 RepID=UPI00301ABD55
MIAYNRYRKKLIIVDQINERVITDQIALSVFGCLSDLFNSGYSLADKTDRHEIQYNEQRERKAVTVSIGSKYVIDMIAYKSFISVYIENSKGDLLSSKRITLLENDNYRSLKENQKVDLWSNRIMQYLNGYFKK